MRTIFGAITVFLVATSAFGQTAQFKCPSPGTVVEFSDTSRSTWLSQEGVICKISFKDRTGDESAFNWYGPTVALRSNQSQAFAEQIKASTLWPLSVGKKISGRFDGVGSTPGFGAGSWYDVITVDSYEKLNTKLGSVDVFVVTRTEEAISHKYRSTARVWYAPALGFPVKTSFSDNQGANRTSEVTAMRR